MPQETTVDMVTEGVEHMNIEPKMNKYPYYVLPEQPKGEKSPKLTHVGGPV